VVAEAVGLVRLGERGAGSLWSTSVGMGSSGSNVVGGPTEIHGASWRLVDVE
jgi:hypothetical protein